VENYRALRAMEFQDLTPLTVLVGPNDSGKSTVFDVFSFLAECFQSGLRYAWDKRGRARELKTRGQNGPVVIEFDYREVPHELVVTYRLVIDERHGGPEVIAERLTLQATPGGDPLPILDYQNGSGSVIKYMVGGAPADQAPAYVSIPLHTADLIAVNALGQFADHPRIAVLREFITGWHVSNLLIEDTRDLPVAGLQEHLSKTGDNLANVVQYLSDKHPDRLAEIFRTLARRVPLLEKAITQELADGHLLLAIKDVPFNDPIAARFVSDGTLKLLAYLVLLHDPDPPHFIGIEEPENFLHPRLMYPLAEDFRTASERSQLLVTTHSPYFLNAMRPEEVRVLYRDNQGYTQVQRAADIYGVREFMEHGGQLGDLWMEGHFNVGDPLSNSGMPRLAAGL
jgi:predicted ATPase